MTLCEYSWQSFLVIFFLSFSPSIPENPSDKLPIKLFLTTSCHTFSDLASVFEVTFKGSKETGQWGKIKKDDLVSILHSFLIETPRIISINNPSFLLGEKFFSPHPTSSHGHCLANQVEIGVCPCEVFGDGVVVR